MSEAFEGVTLIALADRYYAKGDGTRKAISYLRLYEQRLGPRRLSCRCRSWRLGVSSGASPRWPGATIFPKRLSSG